METNDRCVGLTGSAAGTGAGISEKKRWTAPTFQELDASETESGLTPGGAETGSYYPPPS